MIFFFLHPSWWTQRLRTSGLEAALVHETSFLLSLKPKEQSTSIEAIHSPQADNWPPRLWDPPILGHLQAISEAPTLGQEPVRASDFAHKFKDIECDIGKSKGSLSEEVQDFCSFVARLAPSDFVPSHKKARILSQRTDFQAECSGCLCRCSNIHQWLCG